MRGRGEFLSHLSRVLERLDSLYAGAWWWRWRQRRAEQRLARVLQERGERSFEAARSADGVAQMDFAARYWRAAPGAVRCVAEAARREGVPLQALRLMVLNRDLYVDGGRVRVRRSRMIRWLAVVATCIVGFHWFLMMVLALAQNGTWQLKAAVMLGFTAAYVFLYRGGSLYLGRACGAASNYGSQLEAISKRHLGGPVHGLLTGSSTPGDQTKQ